MQILDNSEHIAVDASLRTFKEKELALIKMIAALQTILGKEISYRLIFSFVICQVHS